VFSYSERSNTDAVNLPGKVDVRERKRRSELLRSLSNKKRFDFYSKYTGTAHKVLFETKKNDGYIEGFTENYIRAKTKAVHGLENKVKEVMFTETDGIKPVLAELIN